MVPMVRRQVVSRLAAIAFATFFALGALPLQASPAQPVPLDTGRGSTPDLQDENLLQGLPEGYVIANHARQGADELAEMVPVGESVDHWTEMVTTQIYHGAGGPTFAAYQADMAQHWKQACDASHVVPVKRGIEHGYAFALWLQTCQHADPQQPPEITWFKMIRGNDAVYVVQKAFHFQPSKAQIVRWVSYLKDVTVCDSRLADRACPTAH